MLLLRILIALLLEFCAGLELLQPNHQPELTRRHLFEVAVHRAAPVLTASATPFALIGGSRSAQAKNLPDVAASDLSKVGTVEALRPIIQLLASLKKLKDNLQRNPNFVLEGPLDSRLPETEQSFKGLFDAYSDPVSYKQRFLDQNAFLVYYTRGFDGPGRPSIEQDVNVRQTLQYGYRNEAWVAYDDFLSEVKYARQHPEEFEAADVLQPLKVVIKSIETYLAEAPPEVVLEGRTKGKD